VVTVRGVHSLTYNSFYLLTITLCAEACFPGIGLPGVAASGTIAANSLVGVRQQMALMKELRKNGALQ